MCLAVDGELVVLEELELDALSVCVSNVHSLFAITVADRVCVVSTMNLSVFIYIYKAFEFNTNTLEGNNNRALT